MIRKINIMTMMVWAGCLMAGLPAMSMNFPNFHHLYLANEGERQLAGKNYIEAFKTYSTLAADTEDPELAALAEARAAVALGLQEDKYEEGLAHARAVSDRACAVQACMQLMWAMEDFQRLIEEFGDEDIAAWPERRLPSLPRVGRQDLRALALFDRGRAFLKTGDTSAAERDIDQASNFAGRHHKLNILSFLSSQVHSRALKDADKTFETNMRILELNAGYAATFHAAISAAGYLRTRERCDEALEILESFPWRTWGGFWLNRYVNAVGQTLSAAGRFAEAAEVYRLLAEVDAKRADINARSAAALHQGRMLSAAGDLDSAKNVFRALIENEDIPEDHRRQAKTVLADLAL